MSSKEFVKLETHIEIKQCRTVSYTRTCPVCKDDTYQDELDSNLFCGKCSILFANDRTDSMGKWLDVLTRWYYKL